MGEVVSVFEQGLVAVVMLVNNAFMAIADLFPNPREDDANNEEYRIVDPVVRDTFRALGYHREEQTTSPDLDLPTTLGYEFPTSE